MDPMTLDEALAGVAPADDVSAADPASAPIDLDSALAGLADGADAAGIDLDAALDGVAPAEGEQPQATTAPAEMTAEQKALTPGYYQEHGEPGLGHPTPGPFALAEAAEGGILGAYSGALEIKDLFMGEPEGGRPELDAARERIEERSPLIGPASVAIGQFAAGMIGLKGAGAAVKALPWFGRGAKAAETALHSKRGGALAAELGRDGAAIFITSDPHTERLANILEDTPFIGPVADFLAAENDDGVALGRLKATLEGLGMDVALRAALAGGMAIFKARWRGNEEEALQFTEDLEDELAEAVSAPPKYVAAPEQENLRAIQAGNQNLSRSRGIVGGTEALPEEGSRFPIPEAGNGPGAAPDAANLNPKTPHVRADNDQPAVQSDGVAAVEIGEPREGYATTGALKPGEANGTVPEAANANADLRRPENDNAAFGPVPEGTVRSGGELPSLSADDEVALEAGGLGGTEAPKATARMTSAPRRPMLEAANSDQIASPVVPASRALEAPAVRLGPSLADEDTESLLAAMRSDAEALSRYGSRTAAANAGHAFGSGEGIPYAKLAGADDVNAFLARMVDAEEERIVAEKGGAVLHDADVKRIATDRAKLFGEDPSTFLAMMQGSADAARSMVANAEAGRLVVNRLASDLTALARRLAFQDYSEFGGRAQAYEEFGRRYQLLANVHAAAGSITSNSARATRLAGVRLEVDPALLGDLSKLDTERLVGAFANSDGSARSIAALAKPSLFAKGMDLAKFVYVNNLISGWRTVAVNALSNSYMVGVRPLERILGAAPMALAGRAESQAILREATRQYAYTATAFMDGFQSAVRTLKTSDSILSPQSTELYRRAQGPAQLLASPTWKPWDSTPNVLHNVFLSAVPRAGLQAIGLPTRINGFMDEMTKQTVYRSKVMAKAHVEGAEEATRLGLEGAESKSFVREYVADRLAAAFDDAGRGLDDAAREEAEIATFSQDLLPGSLGQSIQQFKVRHPALNFVLPFVKTPSNILRYGWKMTPGLNLLQKEYRGMLRGQMGAEKQAQAMGQVALGTSAILATASLVSMGFITGGGPKDPKLRQELLATGWQPYSVVVENADGTRSYASFGRLDPIAIPLGIVADLADAFHSMGADAEDQGAGEMLASGGLGLVVALTKQFTSKSYMTGFAQFLDAVGDPEARMGPAAGQMASNFIPFASMLRQTDTDPYMREARSFADKIMDTVPGLGATLPARYDAFGDPLTVRNGLWSKDKAGTVDREMQRLALVNGAAPSRVSPTPQAGVDLRDLTMAAGPFAGRNAYEVYQHLSGHLPGRPALKDMAAKLIGTEAYRIAPDGDGATAGTKLAILLDLIKDYRGGAMEIMKRDPAIRAAFLKRDLKVRDAYREVAVERARAGAGGAGSAAGGGDRPSIGEAFGQDVDAILPARRSGSTN